MCVSISKIQSIIQPFRIHEPTCRSIFNSFNIYLSSRSDLDLAIDALKQNFPNHIIRELPSSLIIIVEPKTQPTQIPIPFKLWLKFRTFINLDTKLPSSFAKLPTHQKESIKSSWESNPYITSTSEYYKLSLIRSIQKHIKSISTSPLSLIKNSITYYKHFPNLQSSYEKHIVPYQRIKSNPKQLFKSFIHHIQNS